MMRLRFCSDDCAQGYQQDRRAGLFGAEAYGSIPESCLLCGYPVPSRATIRARGVVIPRDPSRTPRQWAALAGIVL